MEQDALKDVVRDFLNKHRKAVFATVDDAGMPHTSLMLYAIDDELNVYFGTRKSYKKYAQLLAHPYLALSVIEEQLDPLRVVDIRGMATVVPEEETASRLAFFKEKNPSKYYVEGAEDFVMFKVTPSFIRWLDAESGELTMTCATV